MARYTIELRNLINMVGEDEVKSWFTNYELKDYLTAKQISVIEAQGVWTKDKLAQRIIDHYFMYEIGFETPALFKHQAKVAMQEIMEEKLPLIYSAAIEYEPLINVDYTETFKSERNSQSDSNSSSTSDSSGLTVSSDTPQGQISKSAILGGTYASSTGANENETTIKDTSSNTGSGNESYTKHVKGNSGAITTAQRLVQQYRDIIIMINRDIINDISTLFMGVY